MGNNLAIVLIVALVVAAATIGSVFDNPVQNYKEVQCNDIVRYEPGGLVCEINIDKFDEDIKIYRSK